MHFDDRLGRLPSDLPQLDANAGIDLVPDADSDEDTGRLIVMPRYLPGRSPTSLGAGLFSGVLPRLPAVLLDRPARLGRLGAAQGLTGPLWLLYLDCITFEWSARLPPQWLGDDGVCRADARFASAPADAPGSSLRLAGSVQVAEPSAADELAALTPPFDGVHVLLHLEMWHAVTVLVTVGGDTWLAETRLTLAETHDESDRRLFDRLWVHRNDGF